MTAQIQLKNCNNFDEANITIKLNTLNIKYGANGTGKSTIAKALCEYAQKKDISSLTPFKNKQSQSVSELEALVAALEDKAPSITGADLFKSVEIFNEAYVNQFLFQKDEIISNSFEIFIKTPDYEKYMNQINELLSGIEKTFKEKPEINEVIKDLTTLLDAFGSSENTIAKSSKMHKGYGSGNKIENIPESLQMYTPFIKSSNPNAWVGWLIQGKNYIDEQHDACPYCVAPINNKKETLQQVEKEYKPKDLEHRLAIQEIMKRLGHYFSEETQSEIDTITKSSSEWSDEQKYVLSDLRTGMALLRGKLQNIKDTSFFSLKDIPKNIGQTISSLKIDLPSIKRLNSNASQKIVDDINNTLDDISTKTSQLTGQINQQNLHIQNTISHHTKDINNFLKFAGYRYEVDIVQEEQTYRMLFKHVDADGHLSNAVEHLSYGERNAFSIVLFMYACLAKNPDLIILDDPISSFDKTKKFAIMKNLFTGKNTFKGRTVLMMSHDLEPIIDIAKVRELNSQLKPYNTFLSFRNGEIAEVNIENDDLQSFAQICEENIASEDLPDIIKAIYLRRHYEILDNKGLEYQMLASLFHKRGTPTVQAEINRTFTVEELQIAEQSIKRYTPGFNYQNLLEVITDMQGMIQIYNQTQNRYEKLQLFRIIKAQQDGDGVLHDNAAIRKAINETYHIENEMIIQLNPKKYDFVPEYVIRECDQNLSTFIAEPTSP